MNKNNILITCKKELRSIFRDKKTLLYIFCFPFFIALFVFLLGYMEESSSTESKNYKFGINYDLTEIEETLFKELNIDYKSYKSLDDMKSDYDNKKIDLYITKENEKYYIYTDTNISGMTVSSLAMSYFDQYNQIIGDSYLVSEGYDPLEIYDNVSYEVLNVEGEELDSNKFMIDMVVNMSFTYVIMAIVLAAVNMATSAIATEKEHGTLETLMTLPTTVNELLLGKYVASVIIGFIASIIGLLLTVVSLYLGKVMFTCYEGVSISFISVMIGIVICFVASLIISSIALLLTSSAKTYKEAQAAGQILTFVCVVPIFLMYVDVKITSLIYAIPILNYINILMEMFAGKIDILHLVITILSTIVYSIILLIIMFNKFKSDEVLFG